MTKTETRRERVTENETRGERVTEIENEIGSERVTETRRERVTEIEIETGSERVTEAEVGTLTEETVTGHETVSETENEIDLEVEIVIVGEIEEGTETGRVSGTGRKIVTEIVGRVAEAKKRKRRKDTNMVRPRKKPGVRTLTKAPASLWFMDLNF